MDKSSPKYKVRQCHECSGDTEFICEQCECELCSDCKVRHTTDPKTMVHKVRLYHHKLNFISKQCLCMKHPGKEYIWYCERCKLPICLDCAGHSKHRKLDLPFVLNQKREQHQKAIHTIRRKDLTYRCVLLETIKNDIETCRKECSQHQSDMIAKAQGLKKRLDNELRDVDFKHRCLKEKSKIIRNLISIEIYQQIYEQSATRSVCFLRSKRETILQQIKLRHHIQLSMVGYVCEENVIDVLSEIQIKEREKRHVGMESLIKLLTIPEMHQSLTVKNIQRCLQISSMASDRVWVGDDKGNLILTNTEGETIHQLKDVYKGYGIHTVNSENELSYIDKNDYIIKLSKDLKTIRPFIIQTDSSWSPRCLCWSQSTGDILIGMYGKVTRYNRTGELIKTIEHNNKGRKLKPRYITENNNGDVVVSDFPHAVVVTDVEGRFRFSYTGHPLGSGLRPLGICTDPLSNILVCDRKTNTLQVIDKDDRKSATASVVEGSREIQRSKTKKPHETNECVLNLMYPPKYFQSLTMENVDSCVHILNVASDRLYVSDQRCNLIITNTAGETLHHLDDLGRRFGFTVNSERELIYIDRHFIIKKMSIDMKTATVFIKSTEEWKPQYVYCSLITGDLLVGMFRKRSKKITRFNQKGQPTQDIQHDNNGQELYRRPYYLTENTNSDVVVSDYDAVVVTDCEGKHRLTYTGHPLHSGISPRGICTDALSHILVCDLKTEAIQIIDKDGQFLSNYLTDSQEIEKPWSLGYDVNNHHIWVGSRYHNKLSIYKHITQHNSITDKHSSCNDETGLSIFKPI